MDKVRKRIKHIITYIYRVMKIWITGIVISILDYLDLFEFIGIEKLPPLLQPLILWGSLVFAIIKIYIENQEELESLEATLEIFKQTTQDIHVGFEQDKERVNRLEIIIKPLPTKPDISVLVQEEAEKLQKNKPVTKPNKTYKDPLHTILIFRKVSNPNYNQEVSEYLQKYRLFLEQSFLYSIRNDRFHRFFPAVENIGRRQFEDIEIEFTIPYELRLATGDEEKWDLGEGSEIDDLYIPEPPLKPEKYIDMSFGQAITIAPRFDDNSFPIENLGPIYKSTKDGKQTVVYKVKQLNPGRLDIDLDPFPVWLDNITKDTSIIISVTIYAAQLPESKKDEITLDIKFEA